MLQMPGCGVLYIVATPIGNPDDISARALRVLNEVSLIASEDTRRTGHLLAIHSIRTTTVSYFEHNEHARIPALIGRLLSGESIALVSDAGTPAISDPGFRLVRAAIDNGIRVTAVPGASAAVAALSISGLPTDRFVFEGFLPTKSGERQRAVEQLSTEHRTLVIYETARRLAGLLGALVTSFGPDRRAAIVREITKTHEETIRGTLAELIEKVAGREILGEVTLVVEGANPAPLVHARSIADELRIVQILRETGLGLKDAAAAAAKITGGSRREVYQRALKGRGSEVSEDKEEDR
jgi:16S rRNA (cytidine1402-2'-O)-methyltransferase